MREGWFCGACQAFHAPHIDTCEIARFDDDFECFKCGHSDEKPVRCDAADCPTHLLVNFAGSTKVH